MPPPADSQLDFGYASVVTTDGGDTVWVVGGLAVERYHGGTWTVYETLTTEGSSATWISRVPSVSVPVMAANGPSGMSVWAFDQGAWHKVVLLPPDARQRGLAGIAAANAHTVEAVGWRTRPPVDGRFVSSMLALRGS